MEEQQVINQMKLLLGDIIEISAPTNMNLNENTYYIDYIDEEQINLINVSTMAKTNLYMKDGFLTDESVRQISILSRGEQTGYVRQNGLDMHKWIEIRFDDGNMPETVFGEITNVEDDMIEITRYPDFMKLYIDFEYKGIPKHLPIVDIQIREKPNNLTTEPRDAVCDIPVPKSSIIYDEKGEATYEEGDEIPDANIFDTLEALYKETNDVIFGEDLDDVVLNVEIPEHQRKYGIEIQVNSLLDELLSTIPDEKRSRAVKNSINTLINRYKQLRNIFSKFYEHNDVTGFVYNGPLHKPLVAKMRDLSENIKWIIPVVKQRRALYDNSKEDAHNLDYIRVNLDEELEKYNTIFAEYKNSTTLNRYATFNTKLNNIFQPFQPADGELLLDKQNILQNMDTIVQNLEHFGSSVQCKDGGIRTSKYVVQRYNLGEYKKSAFTSAAGNTVFFRTPMTPNDKMSIQSLLFLPETAVKYSKTGLRGTDIMSRVNYNHFLSFFKIFEHSDVDDLEIIDNLDAEKEYDGNFLSSMKQYLLDTTLYEDADKYEKFLNVLIPPTRALFRDIRKYLKYKLNVHCIVKELEPFSVYMSDICYAQLQEMRFYIKEQIKEFKKNFKENERKYQDFRLTKFNSDRKMNVIERLFFDDKTLYDYIQDGYKLNSSLSNTELLLQFMKADEFRLMYDIMTFSNMKQLMSAEDLLNRFEPAKIDDHGANKKIKSSDCVRRYLSKKYDSLADLTKDNGEENVFFDEEYDDTPYEIMQNYKKEQSSMEPALFRDFLKENLKNRHFSDYVEDAYIEELLDDLIRNKKQVKNGHYALLQLVPKLPEGIDPDALTAADKKQLEIEKETRKKVGYYVRKRNQWVYDSSLDPEMFIDNNSLFCNIGKECTKNNENKVCEPRKTTKMRLDELNKSRMVKEFTNRVHLTVEQINDYYKDKTARDFKQLHNKLRLRDISLTRYNNLAFEIGRTLKLLDIIHSPYADLCAKILDQDDFVKKQGDILRFIEYYCREPLQDVDRIEDQYWYYCKETNTKLLPITSGILAQSYFEGNYGSKLKELCNLYGKMSDDGNAIVDVNSGYELRKIDFVSEDGFTEEGFKIVSHEVLHADIATRLSNIFEKPEFENEQTETIYNIVDTFCKNISIPTSSVSDFVVAQTIEQMNIFVEKQEKYDEVAKKKMAKNPKAKPLPYEVYKNRMMFWLIIGNLIVEIQTAIPSFAVKKTFPGCVKSFGGYPLVGVEDNSTVEYMACILSKLGKDVEPWNAIKKVKVADNVKMIVDNLNRCILPSSIVDNKYKAKLAFLSEHPESDVPEELSGSKWLTFLPPLVPNVMKTLRSVSRDFEKEFITLMREGKRTQIDLFNIVKSKISAHGYGVVSMINEIIKSKDPLLKTASKIPFIDNACCNDSINSPMDYFIGENSNIQSCFQVVDHLSELVQEVKDHEKASILFDKRDTKVKYPDVDGFGDQLIYETVIYYCNLTNDLPIPEELSYIFSEKPEGFPQTTIDEQIEFLKKSGKKFTKVDFHVLMRKIAGNKAIDAYESHYDAKEAVFDILESLNKKDSNVVDAPMRDLLHNLYRQYDPMVMVVEERAELKQLKNYLHNVNRNMFNQIVGFMNIYGNFDDVQFGRFQDYLLKIAIIRTHTKDSLYSMVKFLSNSCYYLSKMYPSIVQGNGVHNIVCSHWGFSKFHEMDLARIMEADYSLLQPFQGDVILNKVLSKAQENIRDLTLLMEFLPIHYNIEKNGNVHVALFDNDCIQLLYTYYWFSCFYEYVSCVQKKEYLALDIESQKKQRRKRKKEAFDESVQTEGQGDIEEVEITMGNEESLKSRLGALLSVFYQLDEQNQFIASSYEQISVKVAKQRYDEKQKIVKALGDITDKFELEIEDQFKKYKMGAWNLGLSKALVHYDANLYDAERDQLEINELPVNLDQPVEAPYDEANDISHLGEDFMDGDYYGDYVDDA